MAEMELNDRFTDAFGALEPEERQRLARLGSVLFMAGSLTAIPAGLFLDPVPEPYEHVISAAGFLLGLICYRLDWHEIAPSRLHFFPIVGTLIVIAGVAVFSVVFSFFLVLAGMFVAISVRDPTIFSAYVASFVLALLMPFAYSQKDLSEQTVVILATVPVLLAVAIVSRYMHEVMVRQKERYRYFATEAMALAERIRGEGDRVEDDSAEALEQRLDDLTRGGAAGRRVP